MSARKKNLRDAGENPAATEKKRPKCYVVGGGYDYIRLMFGLGCDGAKGLDDADFVLFTGGEDVYPGLYNEAALPKTTYNRIRDDIERNIYLAALDKGLPMVGICRGGQFLNVMNGANPLVTSWVRAVAALPRAHVARGVR